VLGALLYHSAKHDPLKDFAPIARTVATPLVLAVHPSLPVKNVRDLVALAKKEPGKLNYASSGAGVIDHLATAMMATRLDIKIEHVPYKGTAPALTDLVGGNTQMFLTTINTVLPFVKDKRLTALAVSSRARSPLLPDVPTLTEATGLNDLELTAWNGLVAPAGTPPAIVAKLNAAVNSALAQPAFQEKMRAMGVEMYGGTPAEYAAFLASETKRPACRSSSRDAASRPRAGDPPDPARLITRRPAAAARAAAAATAQAAAPALSSDPDPASLSPGSAFRCACAEGRTLPAMAIDAGACSMRANSARSGAAPTAISRSSRSARPRTRPNANTSSAASSSRR